MKAYLKIVGISALLLASSSFAAIRCNGQLIDRGDSVVKLIQTCGQSQQNGLNIVYLNKDGDGMNYYIHVQSNGIIDNIQASRGGLR